jgi:hypothetical protein
MATAVKLTVNGMPHVLEVNRRLLRRQAACRIRAASRAPL